MRRPRFLRGPRLARPVTVMPLNTRRLTLGPYTDRDLSAYAMLHDDVREDLGWPIRSLREIIRHHRHRMHHTRLEQGDDFAVWAVRLAQPGRERPILIGDVSLHYRSQVIVDGEPTGFAEIGWALRREYRGNGFAAEAALAVMGVAFWHLGAGHIDAVIPNRNTASQRVAERLGFTPVPALLPDPNVTRYRIEHP